MKTKPDEITLTQWMDGELDGEALRVVELWVQDHPELLAERDAVRAMSASLREHLPQNIEPPYADFFNERIQRSILEDQQNTRSKHSESTVSGKIWHWLFARLAAAAMAVCFYLGLHIGHTPAEQGTIAEISPPSHLSASTSDISVYTPDGTVQSQIFTSTDAQATVIVLKGLQDIPDDMEMAGGPSMQNDGSMMIKTRRTEETF